METLDRRERKARKEHRCDWCCEKILKGEVYDWSKHIYDGYLYEWKTHKKCSYISSELWTYIDPDEGMTGEDFYEGCRNFCETFICPDCHHFDKNDYYCDKDERFCVDKIYDFLQTHELYRKKTDTLFEVWAVRERGKLE